MKATPLAAFFAVILAGLCAFWPAASSAQARGDVFAVAGVQVDVTAANAAEAQTQGFAAAARQGFERLVRRLTPEADQVRLGVPQLDPLALERLALSVDVEEERRSATRYIARLTVRYDADSVRAVLRQAGYNIVDARAPTLMAAPVIAAGAAPELLGAWRDAWIQAGLQYELAPIVVGPPLIVGSEEWAAVEPFARTEAAASVLYAALRAQGAVVAANLTEIGPSGYRRDLGEISARLTGTDAAALRAGLSSLVQQANARLQNEWKARAGVSVAGGGGPTSRVSASALYSDQAQWERIKSALEAAAATVISEIRIEAVGRQGALISFSFTGERTALGEELNRRGVSLEDSAMGPVLRVARR